MKHKCFVLTLFLICTFIFSSCANRSTLTYNETTGYDFSEYFGQEEDVVLKKLEKLKGLENLLLFAESSADGFNYRSYSLDEKTKGSSFQTYISFVEQDGKWLLGSYEKKGSLPDNLSEDDMKNLSKVYDVLCGKYGDPYQNEFDEDSFTSIPGKDFPLIREARWGNANNDQIANFALQCDEKGSNMYLMERKLF